MTESKHSKVIILGSGAAGCTAAIYTARAGLEPMMIHGMQPGGQMTITTDVDFIIASLNKYSFDLAGMFITLLLGFYLSSISLIFLMLDLL